MDWFLLLAQDAHVDALPVWAKYLLGPLGTLVLMGVYAYWTEKKRVPQFIIVIAAKDGLIEHLQSKHEDFRDRCESEKDQMRRDFAVKELGLERDVQDWRDRHTKEKSVRAWYQAQAESLADDAGEKLKPPPDIDRTHYGGD